MTIDIGLYTGLLFGIRSFEPSESHPYWEFHVPLFYIAYMSVNIRE